MYKLLTVLALAIGTAGAHAQLTIPPLNKEIKDRLETKIGKQVDRGECWDLAAVLLNSVNADWDGQLNYGKEINPKKSLVFPGDVIQFEKVVAEITKDNTIYTEEYPHHTAIVYEVVSPGVYKIAHQNNGYSGRKVGITDLDLSTVKKGKLTFYRPIPKNSK